MSLPPSTNRLLAKITAFLIRQTPPCRELVRLLSQEMDHQLPLRQRLSIRLHLALCDGCARYARQLRFLHRIAPSLHRHLDEISSDQLSVDARNELKRTLREEEKKS